MTKSNLSLIALIGTLSPVLAQPAPPPAHHETGHREGRLFFSPMGEPFRDEADNAEAWFTQTDTDHDGKITLQEFRADAMRFFATLDADHDRELGPEEIEHYEQVIAPETGITGGGPVDDNFGHPTQGDDGGSPAEKNRFDPSGQGVTSYSYLALPEPVIAADTDFNRGVSQREFLVAATRRFALLDKNHDGAITHDELPKLADRGAFHAPKRGLKPPRR